ncbi:MAG: 3-dehydroquinate synthase [Myxococcota bacterium]
MSAPGVWKPSVDVEGRFDQLVPRLGDGQVFAIADERVLRLHPHVRAALRQPNVTLASLKAGEGAKSLTTLERLTRRALTLPRALTVLAIGGGTIGDVATVFAHVFKRGVQRLVHVPTTLLAAVDSSVGGKGAVNVGAKNVLGVFHAADEAWLCRELFTTLTEAQRREGRVEALKMVVTLDARRWRLWKKGLPVDHEVIRVARELKTALVEKDPYETAGLRQVLNFGHTMGHVIESLSGYRVRHGEAVGLGMLFVLDLGVSRGVTPPELAREVEQVLPVRRAELSRWLAPRYGRRTRALLAADKKRGWILLEAPGRTREVPFS